MKENAVDGDVTWTGFWTAVPRSDTPGLREEWASGGMGATGITSALPNPFSSEITIQVRLENSGRVRLSLNDQRGREVKILIDDQREAGTIRVYWRPQQLTAGTYLLRLMIDGRLYP